MIDFLKKNPLFTIIGASALLLGIRLYVLMPGLPLTIPELEWMLVGERTSQGFMLYKQTWDDISPLAATLYWVLDWLFGRSQVAYQVMAALLVTLQAVFFNFSLKKNQLYPEKTNLPLLLYAIFSCLFFDFFTLSPTLLALTFLLPSLDLLFKHINESAGNDEIFSMGFYVGVATLFHLPAALFIGFILLSFLMLAATSVQKYSLALVGFAFPITLIALFFYMFNGLEELYASWLQPALALQRTVYVSFGESLIVLAPFILVLLFSAFQLFSGDTRFIHYQVRCQQAVFLWIVVTGVCLLVSPVIAPFQAMLLLPAVTFFGTHCLILARKKWMADVTFLVFTAAVALIGYGNLPTRAPGGSLVNTESMLVQPVPDEAQVGGKKLLVTGNAIAYYANSIPATPYLNWQLAERHFNELDDYATVSEVYENFRNDLPDVIIDPSGKAAELFARIPAIAKYYQKDERSNTYYIKKANVSVR